MNTFDLVLARHGESLAWLPQIPEEFRVIVYETSPDNQAISLETLKMITPSKNCKVYHIPDAGQEPAAYFSHICSCYLEDTLADYTVFSQANPHDHVAGSMMMKLQNYIKIPFNGFLPISATPELIDWSSGLSRRARRMTKNPKIEYKTGTIQDFKDIFLPEQEVKSKWLFPYGAIFGVPKELIYKKPLDFWQSLYTYVGHGSPTCYEAAILERVWPKIFEI